MGNNFMAMKKTELNLREIFVSGKLGPIHFGMTIPELIACIGEPGGEGNFDVHEDYLIKILFYGWYEFKFESFYDKDKVYKLTGMQNDSYDSTNGIEHEFAGGTITLEPWIFTFGMTFEEAKNKLDAEGLTYTTDKEYEVTFIRFENGSTIFFKEDEDDDDALICWGWSMKVEQD